MRKPCRDADEEQRMQAECLGDTFGVLRAEERGQRDEEAAADGLQEKPCPGRPMISLVNFSTMPERKGSSVTALAE